jgi:hypothetical protein
MKTKEAQVRQDRKVPYYGMMSTNHHATRLGCLIFALGIIFPEGLLAYQKEVSQASWSGIHLVL